MINNEEKNVLNKLVHFNEVKPNNIAYRFLNYNGSKEEKTLSFGALYQEATKVAYQLMQQTEKGDRVLLVYPQGPEFIVSFYACLMAGVIAVPVNPPGNKRKTARLQGIINDCSPKLILTTTQFKNKSVTWFEAKAETLWLAYDDVIDSVVNEADLPFRIQDIAFLQYTSGSTGDPKGVMVTHRNLISNLELMKQRTSYDEESVCVSWLPMYHDMGLIGCVLQAVYSGALLVIIHPVDFIKKPIRWLEAITQYKANLVSAPNFAYDLCVSQITEEELLALDLSSLTHVLNASESLRKSTFDIFIQKFKKAGLNEKALIGAYGMAETTLMVSQGIIAENSKIIQWSEEGIRANKLYPPKHENDVVEAVSSGQIDESFVCGIVNPDTLRECVTDEIGEIWLQGASVTAGYWNRPELTKELFQAQIKGKEEGGLFLRTGDLGYVVDGEIFITGRLKEMFIIGGANHYPQDIERTVQLSHDSFTENSGAAFSININGEEKLVIAQEIKRTALRSYRAEALINCIRKEVMAVHDLAVHTILLMSPGRILKTSSGKIQRKLCERLYKEEAFEGIIDQWSIGEDAVKVLNDSYQPSEEVLAFQQWLIGELEALTEVTNIHPDVTFAALGLSSVKGIQLAAKIGEHLHKEVTPTVLYDYPTISSLSAFLIDNVSPEEEDYTRAINEEPIAIISMGCRFPDADTPELFFDNLLNQKDSISEVPATRWNIEDYYEKEGGPNKMTTRWGGFLKNIDAFDAVFFGLSPEEVRQMDPQQRLLLEVSYETLERTGLKKEDVKGKSVGVYIGAIQGHYGEMMQQLKDEQLAYASTGGALSIAANRLSYHYDFRGPSMAIDTACSSSLVAIHQAAKAIRNGECTMALAGGVNVILTPDSTISVSHNGMMASDGRCKAFDDSANGYVRSEGCGLILLKPLSQAQEDGDTVLAVLKGSAVNQDGKSNGLTAPNGLAQQEVIRKALANAQVNPEEIGYVECHGTGTALGDPIEVNAINSVYNKTRNSEKPLVLGAVKANIGHLEASAGIAGVIKAILSLQAKKIPGQVHFNTPNKHISWNSLNVTVPITNIPWEKEDFLRKVGVSSFGFGGTNAHLILEEAETLAVTESNRIENQLGQLLCFSAESEAALLQQIGDIKDYSDANPTIPLNQIGQQLALHKSHYRLRKSIWLNESFNIPESLEITTGKDSVKTVFLFTGQGAQYAGMGAKLYNNAPVFKTALDQCCLLIEKELGEDIRPMLLAQDIDEIHQTQYTQPALFALEYAMTQLWGSYGITPSVLIGHSIGELVAATIAEVFTLEGAITLVVARGKLMQALPQEGKMVSLQTTKQAVLPLLEGVEDAVSIASENSPYQTVISGETQYVDTVVAQLDGAGIKSKALQTSHAFHSPLMEPMLADFKKVAQSITYKKPKYTIISNVTGQVANDEIMTAEYWCKHIRSAVLFKDSIETAAKLDIDVFLEVGPQSVLSNLGTQCLTSAEDYRWLSSMNRQEATVLQSLGVFFELGTAIKWSQVYPEPRSQKLLLPTYPFDRKSYWINYQPTTQGTSGVAGEYFFSGYQINSPLEATHHWVLPINKNTIPEVYDHLVYEAPVAPGAFHIGIMLSVLGRLEETTQVSIVDIQFLQPLFLPESGIELHMIVEPQEGWQSISLYTHQDEEWILHARGKLGDYTGVSATTSLEVIQEAHQEPLAVSHLFDGMEDQVHIKFDPLWKWINQMTVNEQSTLSYIEVPEEVDASGAMIHPGFIDNAFASGIGQLLSGLNEDQNDAFVPFSIQEVYMHDTVIDGVWCLSEPIGKTADTYEWNISLWNDQGVLVAELLGVVARRAPKSVFKQVKQQEIQYQLQWKSQSVANAEPTDALWTVKGNADLVKDLKGLGLQCLDQSEEALSNHVIIDWRWAKDNSIGVSELIKQAVASIKEMVNAEVTQLVWLTQQAQGLEGESINALQTVLWGLAKSARVENPQLNLSVLDVIDGKAFPIEALFRKDIAPEILVRSEQYFVQQLKSMPSIVDDVPDLADKSVMITGGLGDLGVLTANHLVHTTNVSQLILLSRREPNAKVKQTIAAWEEKGVTISTPGVDITDKAALQEIFDKDLQFPLGGIIHAAGVLDDQLITNLTEESIDKVLLPKVIGTTNLHELSLEQDLDFFICYSSIAAVLGNVGQGIYAAANAYMDGLMQHRKEVGLPGVSMNWGPWGAAGMAERLSTVEKEALEQSGIQFLENEAALGILSNAMESTTAQLVVTQFDKEQLANRFEEITPELFKGIIDRKKSAKKRISVSAFAKSVLALPEEQRAPYIEDRLLQEVKTILGTEASIGVTTTSSLQETGLDSLKAVELRNQLSDLLGVKLPATLLFDYPNLEKLSAHLLEKYIVAKTHKIKTPKVKQKRTEEPIAIIGMGCRYGGGVTNPDEFWELLVNERSGITEVPAARWNIEEWYDEDPDMPGKMYARHGGFVENIDQFDAGFFNVSPLEAKSFDPQERLLLETSWEALEHAGQTKDQLKDSNTGVYLGICGVEYNDHVFGDVNKINAYSALGTTHSAISGRISYWLGLTGPNFPVDTACSSSLVSLHLAVQAIRNGECDQALAGGVNLTLDPKGTIYFSKLRALSPTGQCQTFSNNANGYVRGEGCGIVVLKPLSKAKKDGDNILALIKGTAVNQDGQSQGFTAPNGPAQQAVIRKALDQAGITPTQVDYVECHGTGTPLGDPIEVQSLGAVFDGHRADDHPVVLGSVKSNIGHTEGAAGIAGVIKTILSLQHQQIPKSLYAEELNEAVDWENLAVKVAQKTQSWEANGKSRIAGVSSFGFSGTNAHIVLEEAPEQAKPVAGKEISDQLSIFPISAENEQALAVQEQNIIDFISETSKEELPAVAYNLALARTHFNKRMGLLVNASGAVINKITARTSGPTAFLFTGQGSQYEGMAQELYHQIPVFKENIDHCFSGFKKALDIDLKEIIFSNDPLIHQTKYTQAALFSVEYALAKMWLTWGVRPNYLIGHSIGEVVAAAVAEVWSLADAITLVSARGSLMQALPEGGIMVSVQANKETVSRFIRGKENEVTIAAENSPYQTVISGEMASVAQIVLQLDREGIKTKKLSTSHAFHSPLMKPMLAAFESVIEKLEFHQPKYTLVSNSTGEIFGDEILNPKYWVDQVSNAVQFSDGVKTLGKNKVANYLEIGPQAVLTRFVEQTITDEELQLLASVKRKASNATEVILESLLHLYASGVSIDWNSFYKGQSYLKIPLPTYPFQRKRYWIDKVTPTTFIGTTTGHPLLGTKTELASTNQIIYQAQLDTNQNDTNYINEHKIVDGPIIVPAVAYYDLVQGLIQYEFGNEYGIEELIIGQPILVEQGKTKALQTVVTHVNEGEYTVEVYSRNNEEEEWKRHAEGRISEIPLANETPETFEDAIAQLDVWDINSVFYDQIAAAGLQLGSAFQTVSEIYRNDHTIIAKLSIANKGLSHANMHPVLFDGILQLIGAGINGTKDDAALYLPFSIEGYRLHVNESIQEMWVELTLDRSEDSTFVKATAIIRNEAGTVIGTVEQMKMKYVAPKELNQLRTKKEIGYTLQWEVLAPISSPINEEVYLYGLSQNDGLKQHLEVAFKVVYTVDNVVDLPKQSNVIIYVDGSTQDTIHKTLTTVKSLADREPSRVIFIIKNGQCHEGDTTVNPIQTAIGGLIKTAALEHKAWNCTWVDIADGSDLEVLAFVPSNHCIVRDKKIYVQQLVSAKIQEESTVDYSQGTILITGGLGSLGLATAYHLAKNYKLGQLVLLSRGTPNENKRTQIEEIEALGTKVQVATVDIFDLESLKAVVNGISKEYPLQGVIHAAGVLHDGLVRSMSSRVLDKVLQPKAQGVLNLHEATKDISLQLFLSYSSIAAVNGNWGQANYAAANAFLDGFVQYRKVQGLPAQNINWGPWAELGMANNLTQQEKETLQDTGIQFINPEEGFRILDRVITGQYNEVVAVDLNSGQLAEFYNDELPPLFAKIVSNQKVKSKTKIQNNSAFITGLLELPEAQRAKHLQQRMLAEVTAILGEENAVGIVAETPLQETGLDSLRAVELRDQIATLLGVRLPATLLFDYPTIEKLAAHILDKYVAVTPKKKKSKTVKRLSNNEPIAVIGMSCRYPGGADSPEQFWELLKAEKSGIGKIKKDRWDINQWYDADPDTPGKMYIKEGGFVENIDQFDAAFFGISPQEAKTIDPQERLMLETCWEALENANKTKETLKDSNTGVYFGLIGTEYQAHVFGNADNINMYSALGTAHSAVTGRISYWLGLNGPNFPVDTACSSSLVALHLAVQAIRNGECDEAIAGGVNIILDPKTSVYFSKLRALSPTGNCHTFSEKADGFIRSEGCGVVVLKPLSKAQADGDEVLAVIRGSAVNQDGKSQGFTAPNGPAQQAVVSKALTQAGLAPAAIDYVECHGTGTPLGDPIEVQSLGAIFEERRGEDQPLLLGSVKSNIGHTEGAAGIAGVIKTILSFQHNYIPKSLHSEDLNKHIPWEELPVKVAQQGMPWTKENGTRKAGISSFGFSGTNAHVILEEAPKTKKTIVEAENRPFYLLPISAESRAALEDQKRNITSIVFSESIHDVAYSLATTRTHFKVRQALLSGPKQWNDKEFAQRIPLKKTAFLFTGQGAQYAQMCAELYATEPYFKTQLDAVVKLFEDKEGIPLNQVLTEENSTRIHQTEYTQPALFAFEYTLCKLWQHWGVQPDIVIGHSVGEIVAATVAGIFCLEDGVKLIAARGRLMQSLPSSPNDSAIHMVSVQANRQEVIEAVDHELIDIAAENSPYQTVISGEVGAIQEAIMQLTAAGYKTKGLKTSHAFHSSLMEPILAEFKEAINNITFHNPLITIINHTGAIGGLEMLEPQYWVDQIRGTVQFMQGIKTVAGTGVNTFIEIGPQPVLINMAMHSLDSTAECHWLPSLKKENTNGRSINESLGIWYEAGGAVEWDNYYAGREGNKVKLPNYPFQRKRYWMPSMYESADISSLGVKGNYDLAGVKVHSPKEEGHYIFVLNRTTVPEVYDHLIYDTVILPGTFYIGVALAILEQYVSEETVWSIADMQFLQPLYISENGKQLHIMVTDTTSGFELTFYTEQEGDWIQHARCKGRSITTQNSNVQDLVSAKALHTEVGTIPALYEILSDDLGITHNEYWQCIDELYMSESSALARFELKSSIKADKAPIHPAFLDNAIASGVSTYFLREGATKGNAMIPYAVKEVRLYETAAATVWCQSQLQPVANGDYEGNMVFWNEAGKVIAEVVGLIVRSAPKAMFKRLIQSQDNQPNYLYQIAWKAYQSKNSEVEENQEETLLLDWTTLDENTAGGIQQQLYKTFEQIKSIDHTIKRVVCLTKLANKIDANDVVNPLQTALWGMVRSVAQERHQIDFVLVDIASEADKENYHKWMVVNSIEKEFAIRDKECFVPQLVPDTTINENSINLKAKSVLITGGLGQLGRATAEYLVKEKQLSKVVLLGRSEPSEAVKNELSNWDAEVEIHTVDLSDKEALLAVLESISTDQNYPLAGIIHTAGVLDDSLIQNMTQEQFLKVLKPKVTGTWNLHELTVNLPLEFFVMYSSLTAVLGNIGQSHYAMANAFMDGVCQWRKAQGLAAQTINWGPWGDLGMATRLSALEKEQLRSLGIDYLSTAAALSGLGHVLAGQATQHLVSIFNTKQLYENVEGMIPTLYAEVLKSEIKQKQVKKKESPFIEELLAIAAEKRQAHLEQKLIASVQELLGEGEVIQIEPESPLQELGLDSLRAVELRDQLSDLLGKKLPATLLFDYPTLEKLSAYLITQYVTPKEKKQTEMKLEVTPTEMIEVQDPTELNWKEVLQDQIMKRLSSEDHRDRILADESILDQMNALADLISNQLQPKEEVFDPEARAKELDAMEEDSLQDELRNLLNNL